MINQLQTIETKFKELRNGYRNWVSKQSFPLEATVVTTAGAIEGAALGGLYGTVLQVAARVFPHYSPAIQAFSGGPMLEASTLAAMGAARCSITCIMKRIRKKEEDVQTRMASGFGAGVMLGIMMPEADPSVAVNAVVLGVVSALVGAGMFQLGQKTSQSPGDYARTRCMLSDLGLQNYERNFKKGFLTDITMHLLTDSVLREVRVPPGPRLLIIDHIERDPELQKMRQRRVG